MNPPFTRNDIRNRQYSTGDRRTIQNREKDIVTFLAKDPDNGEAASAIDQTSISTFFSPLADLLAKPTRASLAKVLPTTALNNTSGLNERKFLAQRFQIETIVTSHDPDRQAFSENTAIYESLVVARRPGDERAPTMFISLARMPRDPHEAILLSNLINENAPLGSWGTRHAWPWPRIREGDWAAALFYDSNLSEAMHDLQALATTRLAPVRRFCHVDPEGRRVRDAFSRDPAPGTPNTIPILWDHPTDIHRCMTASPDVHAIPKPDKEAYAHNTLLPKASQLLIANRLRTNTTSVAACYATTPLLGSGWTPVRPFNSNLPYQQALCAWWNSTPGILTLLHARAKTLDYPRYSLDALRNLLVPRPDTQEITHLIDAFQQTSTNELLPWPRIQECSTRTVLDQAAAQVLRLPAQTVAEWRTRIAAEPTVTGLSVHNSDGTGLRATGKSVARAGGASKRSREVIGEISIDRRDAIRELANR